MISPFPLYVDEISPDKIKATVSTGTTILHNLRTMSLDMPMAEKLDHVDLQEKFRDTYAEIMRRPESHKRFVLVVGNAEQEGGALKF